MEDWLIQCLFPVVSVVISPHPLANNLALVTSSNEAAPSLTMCLLAAHVIAKAEGLAIISVIKAGFMVTARAGSGIVIARLADRRKTPDQHPCFARPPLQAAGVSVQGFRAFRAVFLAVFTTDGRERRAQLRQVI